MLAEIVLPADTDRVTVEDIPTLFADAIHGRRNENADDPSSQDFAWAATVIEYEKAVKKAVMHRELIPRNSMTLLPMPGAMGQAMFNGVLTVSDLAEFAAQFEIGVRVASPSEISQQYAAQAKAKADAGRYTLEEAATVLSSNTGERADEMREKFEAAVRNGKLNAYEPGKQAVYQPEVVRTFYEEVYWCDLNAWLDANEPRIKWRYPEPLKHEEIIKQQVEAVGTEEVTSKQSEPDTKNWILRVQAEAARRWRTLKASGAKPTKHNIKDDLETWCVREKVESSPGITPSGSYIYRHALRNWNPPTD